jgi:hypothetical protein
LTGFDGIDGVDVDFRRLGLLMGLIFILGYLVLG